MRFNICIVTLLLFPDYFVTDIYVITSDKLIKFCECSD